MAVTDATTTIAAESETPSTPPTDVVRVGLRPSRAEWSAFLVVLVGALLVTFISGTVESFYYDSSGYWVLSTQFSTGGHWSFWHLVDPTRGIVPVFFFGELRVLSEHLGIDGRDTIRVVNALIFSGVGTVLLPRLAMRCWPRIEFGFVRRVLVGAVFLVFWWGYLAFPLTDVPTLALAITALLLVARRRRARWLVLGGFVAVAAMNMRPAYLLFIPGFLVVGIVANGGGPRSAVRRLTALGAMVLGMAVVAVPQSLLTHHNYKIWSPVPGAAAHLGPYQLTVGLQVQLYSTFVGDRGRTPMVIYYDTSGKALIEPQDLGPDGNVKGSGQYLRIALRHPVTFAAVIGRHVVNGLDQRYSTPFPATLDTGQRRVFRIAGFLLLFVGLLRLLWGPARRSLGGTATWLPLGALSLGIVTSLPAAMEQRFMLPVFVIALVVAFAPGWREVFAETRTQRQRLVTAGVIGLCGLLFMGFALRLGNHTTQAMQLVMTPASRAADEAANAAAAAAAAATTPTTPAATTPDATTPTTPTATPAKKRHRGG